MHETRCAFAVLCLALGAGPALGADSEPAPPRAALPGAAPAPEAAPASTDTDAADAEASEDAAPDADAPDDPDVEESARELQDMRNAEERSPLIEAADHAPAAGAGRLGAANPLRARLHDAGRPWDAGLALPDNGGPAIALLPELAGVDLKALQGKYDIPIEVNEAVVAYIRFFQTEGRPHFEKWLARAPRFIPMMREILQREGLPLDTVYLSMIESGFSTYAYSWARASGQWQFISGTGRLYGLRNDFWLDDRREPEKATLAAARFLRDLNRRFGDWRLAWAAYNGGPGKVSRAIDRDGTRDFWELTQGRVLRRETKHYVPKLMAAAILSKHLDRFGFASVEPEPPYAYETAEVADATDLFVVARAAGVSFEDVKALNPELRRFCTPPGRHRVKLPQGSAARFAEAYAKIPPSQRLTYRHHRVQRGDTLGAIAGAYRTPVEAIMRINRIANARRLMPGMELLIPLPTQLAGRVAAPAALTPAPLGSASSSTAASASPPAPVPAAVSVSARDGAYVVQAGDTLWSISQKFGVSIDDLKRWNGIARGGHRVLQVGRELQISAPGAASPSGPARAAPSRG